jgi:hypothetical protein
MNNRPISEKRQKLIDEVNDSAINIGDSVAVKYESVHDYTPDSQKGKTESVVVTKILSKTIKVKHKDNSIYNKEYTISHDDIVSRNTLYIGENPFDERTDHVRSVNYDLGSVIFSLNILGEKDNMIEKYEIEGIPVKALNWNPYVYDKSGNKEYYQRDFVWSLEDKQTLVDSIYQGIDCGKILVRKRGWYELRAMAQRGEKELAFNDIVDGKQRLDAVRGFIQEEYVDSNGNSFGDLCHIAQIRFTNHQLLSYSELPEDSKDEDVIHQFLKLNFTGVLQSPEHIEFVKEIHSKF